MKSLLEVFLQLLLALPEVAQVLVERTVLLLHLLELSCVVDCGTDLFSLRTISASFISLFTSLSVNFATFVGEKFEKALSNPAFLFSTTFQFNPAEKMCVVILSKYPRSSFGGVAFQGDIAFSSASSVYLAVRSCG